MITTRVLVRPEIAKSLIGRRWWRVLYDMDASDALHVFTSVGARTGVVMTHRVNELLAARLYLRRHPA